MQLVSKLRRKYRSKRSDGLPLTTLDSDTPPASSATPTTSSTPSNFPATETSTTTNKPVSISLQEVRKQIWNDAYDEAKKDEPKIFEQYEKILSVQLRETSAPTSDAGIETNAIKQDTLGRQLQMMKLIEMGLAKTEKSAKVKGKIKEGMQPILNIKEFVATAVKFEPTAAIAWVGVTACMDIITNTVNESDTNLYGVKFVLERSQWHWELTQLLLDIGETDTSLIELQGQLKLHIVRLYKKLLLYQIQSVVLYDRKPAGVIIRDVFKVDDWQQKIDAIKSAEEALRRDVEQYDSEELKRRLRVIDSTLKDLRLDIQAVETAVEQQTLVLRKLHHDDKDKECLARLCVINPETHKAKIQRTGGGLLKDSYEWILDHEDFRRFRSDPENCLLWIRGDPGKGKTMLLCGIIDELKNESSLPLTYAFCQATHGDFRSATSVLRSLIWLLCKDHPELISHVRERHDVEGETPLKDITALQSILGKMLGEIYLRDAVLLVDALDECLAGRTELIDIISDFSGSFPAKWIVSSRNWPDINGQLQQAEKDILSLELNKDSISQAVSVFVEHKMKELALRKRYSPTTQEAVLKALLQKARDTFIWVALVCAELDRARERHAMVKLESIPGDLTRLYDRMLEHVIVSHDADSCRHILSVACVAFRPLTLSELQILVEELGDHSHDVLREIIGECGSFLTIQEDVVYFIHQSAQDFLIVQGKDRLSHSSIRDLHRQLFVRSLGSLKVLKRNPYKLGSPGVLASDIVRPESDPLASLEYPCVYWIDHLNELGDERELSDDKRIEVFVGKSFLHWLEALSILQKIPEAVKSIQSLRQIVGNTSNGSLKELVDDMRRFVLLHMEAKRIAPLQVCNSALVFTPSRSTIREMFKHEEPDWINLKPNIPSNWDPCIQTLQIDDLVGTIQTVQFSSDGRLFALTDFCRILSWDVLSGRRLRDYTIDDDHNYDPFADSKHIILLSHNGKSLVGACFSDLHVWDVESGERMDFLISPYDHSCRIDTILSSPDGQSLAVVSRTLKPEENGVLTMTVWDWPTFKHPIVPQHPKYWRAPSLSFSSDSKLLASTHETGFTVWNAADGACVWEVRFSSDPISFFNVATRHTFIFLNETRLACQSNDTIVKIWDTTARCCIQTLQIDDRVDAIASIGRNGQVAVASSCSISVCDDAGSCLQTFRTGGGNHPLAFFAGQNFLAEGNGYHGGPIRLWDLSTTSPAPLNEDTADLSLIRLCPPDGRYIAGSVDSAIKLWNVETAHCLHTLAGHKSKVEILTFSPDGFYVLSVCRREAKLWDAEKGCCLATFQCISASTPVWSPNSQWFSLVRGVDHPTVEIWDVLDRVCVQQYDHPIHSTYDLRSVKLAVAGDGGTLASLTRYKLKIWDIGNNRCTLDTEPPEIERRTCIAISTHSKWVAVGSDSTIYVLDVSEGSVFCTYEVDEITPFVHSVAFSTNEEWLASASNESLSGRETVQIWRIGTETCFRTLEFTHASKTLHTCNLRFSLLNSTQLHTRTGTLELQLESDVCSAQNSFEVRYCGYGQSIDGMWICKGSERLLFLPSEYRKNVHVMGSTIALQTRSRRKVWFHMKRFESE